MKEIPKICKTCKKPIETSWYGIQGKIGLYCKRCFDKLPAKDKHVGTFQIKSKRK